MGRIKLSGEYMKEKRRWIMSNLVYGQNYPMFWLENQLKSLCDPTNLPALKDEWDLEYVVFTDEETLQQISKHPNFMRLSQLCEISIIRLNWPPDSERFESRYELLAQMLRETLKVALEKKAYAMSAWVADLVFAKGSCPKMLSHLTRGHDATFMVPIRSAADSVHPLLARLPGAPHDLELFEMAYANLHSLWTHSTWDNPYFTRMPYSFLWNSGTGLCVHNFSVTPIVFRPLEALRSVTGGIDTDMPLYFQNPYWCTDWTDAAVAGVEPLSNGHYPPFSQVPVTGSQDQSSAVALWSLKATVAEQTERLELPLFYPSRRRFNSTALEAEAAATARNIKDKIKLLRNAQKPNIKE
jgi:hypothetical protein